MAERHGPHITAGLLAGGEGRRVNGQDKGLLPYQGRALAEWVMNALAPQCDALLISANRNAGDYRQLRLQSDWPLPKDDEHAVWPDDSDLPTLSGPLAGIITLLRHAQTEWVMFAPCDTPHLPADLVARLMREAMRSQANIVVPQTREPDGTPRPQWVCALVHKRVCPETQALFVKGERKVGNWIRSQNWSSVSFADDAAFTNMNTLETLHGRA